MSAVSAEEYDRLRSDSRRVARELQLVMAACGFDVPPPAEPLRVLEPSRFPTVTMLDGTETPVFADTRWREVWPVHQSGRFAVYEVRPGVFEVHRNGQSWGRPFSTTDRELAMQVCDRWAREFGTA